MTDSPDAHPKATGGIFELIVEGAPDALLMIDCHRRIRLVNRKVEDLFGYPRQELVGQAIELLVPSRYRDGHPILTQGFLEHPNARPMGAGRDLFGLHKSGAEIPIEIGLNPIQTADGLIVLASIIDITLRRRHELMHQRMTALVESAEDAIVTKSLDGTVRSWNPGAERLLGYSADEIIGQSVLRLIPDDHQDEELMIVDRIKRGQRVAHFETIRRRKDGSLIDVSLTISPILDRDGHVVGASKIMRDITERKRHENELRTAYAELKHTNEELDSFADVASHDLRSPLTGVGMIAQWILDDDLSLSENSRKRLFLIQSRIERMQRLLNDIREYARAGRFSVPTGPLNTAEELVRDVCAVLHVPAGFLVETDSSLRSVLVRRVPLEQVLLNLISNSIKHHDRATGAILVSLAETVTGIRFSVTDDGPGVPEQYQRQVMQMFSTLKPRDRVEGSGMGLALVRKIVGRLGGECGFRTNGERGTTFWFDWPKYHAELRDEN